MIHTTLRLLRDHEACGQGRPDGSYCKLVASLPQNHRDDDLIPLTHVLLSNGIDDTLWALRACIEPKAERVERELSIRAAERVLPIFEDRHPDDARPRLAIVTARRSLRGEASTEELASAEAAARSAAWIAAWASAEAAARSAAWGAAWAAAEAAGKAAWKAAWAAAEAAGKAAGDAAAWAAERAAQERDLLELLGATDA